MILTGFVNPQTLLGPLRRPGILWHRMLLLVLCGMSPLAANGFEVPRPLEVPTRGSRTAVGDPDAPLAAAAEADAAANEAAQQLVRALNAASFERRSAATRELIALGKAAIPALVDSLPHATREVRERIRWVLTRQPFGDVAPHMLQQLNAENTRVLRSVLRQSAVTHLADVCRRPHAERLFRLWDTTAERYTVEALKKFNGALSPEEFRSTVEALLMLDANLSTFQHVSERLERWQVPTDHLDSTGSQLTRILARGLLLDRPPLVDFATRYVDAIEQLAARMTAASLPDHEVRQQLRQRADWSRGAMLFLAGLRDEEQEDRELLQGAGLTMADLDQAFFDGLAADTTQQFMQQVGRAHIADMLCDALRNWPQVHELPQLEQLITRSVEAAQQGDKPRALACLDALTACRALPDHHLQLQRGLGKQMANRLAQAALAAPHFKAYYPARSVHDKILSLVDLGIHETHRAFPRATLGKYLADADAVVDEPTRRGLERWVRIWDRLQRIDDTLAARSAADPLIKAMNDALQNDPQRLGSLLAAVEQFQRQEQAAVPLDEWIALLATTP